MRVRRMQPEEFESLRAIRLRALLGEPSAFGSTHAREVAFTDDVWQHRLRADGNPHFVSDAADGTPNGIAVLGLDDPDPAIAELLGMWVDPAARASGVADALVTAVSRAAHARGCSVLRLQLSEGNDRAERLYLRHGFARTNRAFDRARDGSCEVEMECDLRSPPSA